jgi:hypothetical protein
MKIYFIPFQIGMQYENWEFDLEPIETKMYDKYKYIKNDIEHLFSLDVKYIYLYFDLEILFKVEIGFKSENPPKQLITITENFKKKYGGKKMKLTKGGVTWTDKYKRLKVENQINKKQVVLVLIDNKYNDL